MEKYTKAYFPTLDSVNAPYNQLILKTGEAKLFEGFIFAEQQS